MFTNRYIKFGFLSIIIITFGFSMGCATVPTNGGGGGDDKRPGLIIKVDGETGRVVEVTNEKGDTEPIKKERHSGQVQVNDFVKAVEPASIFTSGKNSCIIFVIGGYAYHYCW